MKSGTSLAAAIPFVIAVLAIPTAAQTLNVSVEGQGKVTGTGIDCPSDCTENFLLTTIRVPGRPSPTIVLTAAPAEGYQLGSWTGKCQEELASQAGLATGKAASATCTVAIESGGTTVSATFVASPPSRLNIVLIGSRPPGSVTDVIPWRSPSIIESDVTAQNNRCALHEHPDGCTWSDPQGGSWLIGTRKVGFAGWGGACSGMGEDGRISYFSYCTISISLGETKTVYAKFATVAISAAVSGPGNIVASPPDAYVSPGTVVTFRAEPNPGASFVGWGEACAGSVPVCTVTVDSNNIAVRAQFGDFSVGVAGSGSVQIVSQADPAGLSIRLVAEPAAGHVFAGWLGGCSGTSSTCTPASGAKVTAVFHPGP